MGAFVCGPARVATRAASPTGAAVAAEFPPSSNGPHRTGVRGSWDEARRPYPSRESDRALFRRPSVSGGAQSPSQRHGLTERRSTPHPRPAPGPEGPGGLGRSGRCPVPDHDPPPELGLPRVCRAALHGGREGAAPQLKRVIVGFGDRIAMEETLDGAVARVFGGPLPQAETEVVPSPR